MRELAHNDSLSAAERGEQAREVVRTRGAYELRYRMQIVASPSVAEMSEEVFRELRGLRDRIFAGDTYREATYSEQRIRYVEASRRLRAAMRDEVQVELGL
ncbi:hypothetical protein [Streptomyces sp. NPDC048196]|uniref:hypothetical protein n=1 Tax=Streptomyces sp. NPDC048196 TaxID=3154712 RepID=UPI0033FB7199